MESDRTGGLWVLGASGFLGVHLVEAAARRGRRGGGVSRGGPGPHRAGSFLHVPGDLAAPGVLERLLETWRPDSVVLAAAVSRVDRCERDPDGARALNSALPARLAVLAERAGVRALLVSTDLVFGAEPAPCGGFGEDAQPGPTSVYGATKWAGERAFLEAHPRGVVARLPLLFGDGRGRGLGASESLLHAVAKGERPFLFEDEWRTPLDVQDGAELLLDLLESDAQGVVHVPGPERVSRAEFGERLFRAPPWPFERGPRAARGADERPKDTSLCSKRIGRWIPRGPLDLATALLRAHGPRA